MKSKTDQMRAVAWLDRAINNQNLRFGNFQASTTEKIRTISKRVWAGSQKRTLDMPPRAG